MNSLIQRQPLSITPCSEFNNAQCLYISEVRILLEAQQDSKESGTENRPTTRYKTIWKWGMSAVQELNLLYTPTVSLQRLWITCAPLVDSPTATLCVKWDSKHIGDGCLLEERVLSSGYKIVRQGWFGSIRGRSTRQSMLWGCWGSQGAHTQVCMPMTHDIKKVLI